MPAAPPSPFAVPQRAWSGHGSGEAPPVATPAGAPSSDVAIGAVTIGAAAAGAAEAEAARALEAVLHRLRSGSLRMPAVAGYAHAPAALAAVLTALRAERAGGSAPAGERR